MFKQLMLITVATAMCSVGLVACGSESESSVDSTCKPKHKFDTLEKGVLTVVGYDLPPFSSLKDNKMQGVDPDILSEIAKMECLTTKPKWVATAAVIPSVQNKRADVASGTWYRTVERMKVVNQSDPVYLDEMAFISKDGVKDFTDLKGRAVGTVQGYLWNEDLKKYLGGKLKLYPNTINMNQDLKAGRVDIGVDGAGSSEYNYKGTDFKVEVASPNKAVAASVEPAQIGFPLGLENEAMLKAFNEDLKQLHESGKIAEILEKNGLSKTAADVGKPRAVG